MAEAANDTVITGTIIKGVGGLYTVDANGGLYACKPRGIFRKERISPLVGDVVEVSLTCENEGVITSIKDRSTCLNRPKAANVSQALLVMALKQPDLNYGLLDRFIITCEASRIDAVLCFNKLDLAAGDKEDVTESIKSIYGKAGYNTVFVSASTGEGVEELKAMLSGKVSVLAGPSGAGKSSISNLLSLDSKMETGELSRKIQRGKHTTRHAELLKIGPDSYIIDSPGFSTVYFDNVDKDNLRLCFREFKAYEGQCRFNDCRHADEPECAIKDAVLKGGISAVRYARYLECLNELS